MLELGQLEKQQAAFAERNVQIVAISNDDLETAKLTQSDFPHLVIVSDLQQNLAKAVAVIDPKAAPDGSDTNAPTTILLDDRGFVRKLYRPERFLKRLSPEQLLALVDEIWK